MNSKQLTDSANSSRQAEQVMKSANVEMLMGHDIGVSKSYYKPQEKDVMEDYLKVVNKLTISKSTTDIIEKQNAENRFMEMENKLREEMENKISLLFEKVRVENLRMVK